MVIITPLLPSTCGYLCRYKAKLVEGATSYGLSPTYIEWLKALPSVDDSMEGLPEVYYHTPSTAIAQIVLVVFAAVVAVALTVYMEADA